MAVDRARSANVATHVRRILVERGLSVSDLNALSAAQGHASPASRLPHAFFSMLKKGIAPHVSEVAALSNLTNFLFIDWLALFGFDLAAITRLQVKLHTRKTTLVMPTERLLPLQIPREPPPESAASDSVPPHRPLLFAKVGMSDGMAFPAIIPGSIVSIDTARTEVPLSGQPCALYLVEHLRGLSCCYASKINKHEVLLTPRYLPYPCLRYRIGEQAIILGAIDSELRPLKHVTVPHPAGASLIERHSPLRPSRAQSLSQFMRSSRERIGLRFREAKSMTESIALEMGNEEYAIALGSLSDYEAADTLPRHISKIISLCITYGIDLIEYMAAAGILLCEDHKTALPPCDASDAPLPSALSAQQPPDLRSWSESWYRLPVSLLRAFAEALPDHLSCHWMQYVRPASGEPQPPGVPEILLVDKNDTQFESATWATMWQRPAYLVRHCSGRLVYGFCAIADGLLIVHEETAAASRVESFSRYDAEVIGRVVVVLRAVNDR